MSELFKKSDRLKYSRKNENGEHTEIEIPWDLTTFLVFLFFLFIGLAAGLVESDDIQKTIAFVKIILP